MEQRYSLYGRMISWNRTLAISLYSSLELCTFNMMLQMMQTFHLKFNFPYTCTSWGCLCSSLFSFIFTFLPSHQRFSNRKIRCKLIIKAFVATSSYEMAFHFMFNKSERCFTWTLTAVWMASYTFGLYVWMWKFIVYIYQESKFHYEIAFNTIYL